MNDNVKVVQTSPFPPSVTDPNAQVAEAGHAFASGAKRSEIKPSYHLIPHEALTRLAQRYTMGAEKYGIHNYLQGINDPEFVTQLIDHLEDHLGEFKNSGCLKEDNLAAIMWGAATLMLVETYNPTIIDEIVDSRQDAIRNAVLKPRPARNLYAPKFPGPAGVAGVQNGNLNVSSANTTPGK